MPIVVAVACVSVLAALNRELLTPRFRDKFSRNAQDLADNAARRLEPRYDNHTGILIRGRQLLTNQQTIQEPNFMLPRELDDYGRHLAATAAVYQPATTGRPAGFLFQNVSQPRDITTKPSLKLASGEPAIFTPRNAPWLEPNECFVIQRRRVRSAPRRGQLAAILVHLGPHSGALQSQPRLRVGSSCDDPFAAGPAGARRRAVVPRHTAGPTAVQPKRVCRHRSVHRSCDPVPAGCDRLPLSGIEHPDQPGAGGLVAAVCVHTAGGVDGGANRGMMQ